MSLIYEVDQLDVVVSIQTQNDVNYGYIGMRGVSVGMMLPPGCGNCAGRRIDRADDMDMWVSEGRLRHVGEGVLKVIEYEPCSTAELHPNAVHQTPTKLQLIYAQIMTA